MDNRDTLLTFPCEFPLKVIGHADADLDSLVFSLVRPHAPDLGEAAITSRASSGGRYQSVTVRLHATSREQLDAIYRALTASDRIIMVL